MTELSFAVTGARPQPHALAPVLDFALHVDTGDTEVQSLQLRCQVRVEPGRRGYRGDEQALLQGQFGDPGRWGETLTPFLLAHATLPIGGFRGTTDVTLPVPLSYDLEVTTGAYLHALRGGDVPLLFLFSGTLFRRTPDGPQVEPIPWDREARFALPVATWEELMDQHFPGTGWVRLRRDTIDALQQYRSRHALPAWDDVIASLLAEREAPR